MAIFDYQTQKKNDFLEGSLPTDLSIDESTTLMDIGYLFDSCISLLEEADASDDTVLQESIIDDLADNFKDMVAMIIKGRQEALEDSIKAAKEAEEYQSELQKFARADAVRKSFPTLELWEFYTITVQAGNTMVTHTEYRKAQFSKVSFSFSQLKDMKNEDLKKLYRRNIRYVGDLCRFTPTIGKRHWKGDIPQLAKMLADRIKSQKKACDSYKANVDKLVSDLQKGQEVLKSAKESGADSTKWIKRFMRMQKQLYIHDLNLLMAHNRMILKQSREIAKFIKKFQKFVDKE